MNNQVFNDYFYRNAPQQTKTILGLFLATVAVSIFVSLSKGKPLKICAYFAGLILITPLLYNTSCLVIGGCNIWAWISILGVSIIMILNIFSIIKDEPEEYESCNECM